MDEYRPESEVSPDLLVLAVLGERNHPTFCFSELVKALDGRVSRSRVSGSIDRLFDLGLIEARWSIIDEHRWAFVFVVTGVGSGIAKEVSDYLEDEDGDV